MIPRAVSSKWKLTILGRSLLLIAAELLANAACWIIAGLLFGRRAETRGFLSLALLAWTIGLRHGLDADHISAIDNATRGLISLGQLPVTCGLFFSLGHSTIVIAVNVAIAISTDIYNKIGGVGNVGGIIGAAVSASFLFIIGLANSIFLYRIIRSRRRRQTRLAGLVAGGESALTADARVKEDDDEKNNKTLMMRILGPVTTFVNHPWKMYPVGVLFGLSFDTASSIALLAVSALAKKGTNGKGIPQADIVILPFLFTAGMTFVDSADSILMLYSYAGFPEKTWALFERMGEQEDPAAGVDNTSVSADLEASPLPYAASSSDTPITEVGTSDNATGNNSKVDIIAEHIRDRSASGEDTSDVQRRLAVKQNTMSGLSIVLTLISILVAFSISLITIMGLIGDNCGRCQDAANAEGGGGIAGKWWRGWEKANDESGFIGAAIVGGFIVILCGWYGGRWVLHRTKPIAR